MRYVLLPAIAAGLLFTAGCEQAAQPAKDVSFASDIVPILKEHCLECHEPGGKGHQKSGLLMVDHAALMAGTKHGPIVVPGDADSSVFSQVLEGRVDKSIRMPHGGAELPAEQVAMVRNWIEQGAKNN